MLRSISTGIIVASLVVANTAFAEPGKGGSGPGGGSSGGGGNAAGEVGGQGVGASDQFGAASEVVQPDEITGEVPKYKKWEVSATMETHRLVRTDDLAGGEPTTPAVPAQGAADDKFMNAYTAKIRYDLTSKDRFTIRAYLYQRFLADQGENGFRLDDTVFTYTRLIPLPQKFRLQASAWLTAPTSYDSQISGLITAPRVVLEIDRWFGTLNLDFRTYDEVYIQRYDSYAGSGGATPNPSNRIAVAFDAEYHMPFHQALSVGLGLYTAWTWYYNINTGNLNGSNVNSTEAMNGVVQDPTFSSQPIQQIYGGEVFVRYELPSLVGVKSDFSIAYAQGDPTIGYTNVLHDGVGHAYLGYRQTSEVYASLGVRY